MTQIQTLKTTEPTLDEQIERATAMRDKLAHAATEADAEAQRWATTFQREPTQQAFAEHAVAMQRAANAHAAVETFESDTLTPLRGKQRRALDEIERAALAEKLNWAKAEALTSRIESAITNCRSEMLKASAELAEFLLTRADHSRRASELGLSIQPEKFSNLMMSVNDRLGAGVAAKDPYGNALAVLTCWDQGTQQTLRVEVSCPMHVNRRVL